ncbi:DNA ligase [Gordonia spumicola]|uniref:DNA ligase (ATP) n=2 Tax=Gordonia spumicola TaxID=589161 RepID=A0A7I9VCW9_9ACTN|nr:DNA ligase [Gordonia spumicola]
MLQEVVAAAADVAATRSRTAKARALADLIARVEPDDAPAVTGLILGRPRQGRLGVGWRTLIERRPEAASAARLTVRDVDEAFTALASASGTGSAAVRVAILDGLLSRADAAEQDHLIRVMTGEMRTGALEGVLVDAAALALRLPTSLVRRAAMLTGDIGATIGSALRGDDLTAVDLTPGVPAAPMLAGAAPTAAEAMATSGAASVEYKLDGARLQVHRVGGTVTAYTRSLADITARVPDVVAVVESFPGGDLVLDGETLALDESGAARPFQDTMSSLGRDGASPLHVWFFDILYGEGRSLIDEPLRVRRTVLAATVGEHVIGGSELSDGDADGAQRVLDDALAAGHEGVVVKSLDSTYAAGRRGAAWVKVKPVYTYDLVVLAVEEGSGRRSGMLSNIHLGARDPDGDVGEPGGFVMVGKTFKGLTDRILAWQTDHFPTIATRRDGHVLHLRPEVVVEVAVDGVQRSSRYPGGIALRFARVKRYRIGADEKPPTEADTIADLRALRRD